MWTPWRAVQALVLALALSALPSCPFRAPEIVVTEVVVAPDPGARLWSGSWVTFPDRAPGEPHSGWIEREPLATTPLGDVVFDRVPMAPHVEFIVEVQGRGFHFYTPPLQQTLDLDSSSFNLGSLRRDRLRSSNGFRAGWIVPRFPSHGHHDRQLLIELEGDPSSSEGATIESVAARHGLDRDQP